VKTLNALRISGKDVLPLVEGGKGVAVSNGESSGAWALAGGVGTFSAVNADSYDANGKLIPQVYKGKTRQERHEELVAFGIEGGVAQAQRAFDVAGGKGRIHVNVLWEMGGAERVLQGVLEKTRGLVHGITCGAGMPYRVSEIAAKYNVHYYPIVSSARALRALWLRSYHKLRDWLGGVVYEDPWLAGGHNGLSNSEDPRVPEAPFGRVLAIREFMREHGLGEVPIIMAGGVWWLSEWEDWIDNPDLGPIAFQFGTRPLLTKESPIPDLWKKKLMTLKKGDVVLNRFSPTGFYSSAAHNSFMRKLEERTARQISYATEPADGMTEVFQVGAVGKPVYVSPEDRARITVWNEAGFTRPLRTPDHTLVFVTPEKAKEIQEDQTACMGCLSACSFSNWSQNAEGTTGRMPDPRSFCIQKTLQNIAHGKDPDGELMFAGHNAYRFGDDPFYANGFVPTVKELVERIRSGL
jgi:NAD(P)H-dependent flavin oxidoreductase YrpB (nitropropane dioxygenase family)